MSDTEVPVLAEVRNRVGHLALNRPVGLNALTLQMIRITWRQLHAWESDPEIVAVVLRANGVPSFKAKLGSHKGTLALQVTEPIERR